MMKPGPQAEIKDLEPSMVGFDVLLGFAPGFDRSVELLEHQNLSKSVLISLLDWDKEAYFVSDTN